MSGVPRVRPMNMEDNEQRPVLVPAGNKARTAIIEARKPAIKSHKKVERSPEAETNKDKKQPQSPNTYLPSILRYQHGNQLLRGNLSLNASCSSDASTDSSHSRASTGRICRSRLPIKRKQRVSKLDKVENVIDKVEKVSGHGNGNDEVLVEPDGLVQRKRCSWVTSNTDLLYAKFHDEEWGVPVHDDSKLFELLSYAVALAELTWPIILNKRNMFREVFLDFDPISVSKLNEKKIIAPGAPGSTILSELKLRNIVENARQVCKTIEEFGSFDKYIWGFMNHKPMVNKFRYPRQVPVKTSKADMISKDFVRRGFRGVGPTVVYSFMQAAGLTNDHLITCFRFPVCVAAGDGLIDKEDFKVRAEEDKQGDDVPLEVATALEVMTIGSDC